MPIIYSLYNPRGLTSLRIYLFYQSILFYNRVLIAPYLQSPLIFKSFLLYLKGQLALRTRLFIYIYYPPLKPRDNLNKNSINTL